MVESIRRGSEHELQSQEADAEGFHMTCSSGIASSLPSALPLAIRPLVVTTPGFRWRAWADPHAQGLQGLDAQSFPRCQRSPSPREALGV